MERERESLEPIEGARRPRRSRLGIREELTLAIAPTLVVLLLVFGLVDRVPIRIGPGFRLTGRAARGDHDPGVTHVRSDDSPHGGAVMDRDAIDAMAGRLDRLERENHRLWRVGLVGVAGVLAAVLLGAGRQEGPGEVRGTRFVLVDEDGKTMGRWEPSNRGAWLELKGADGSSKLSMGFPRRMTVPNGIEAQLFKRKNRMLLEQPPYPEIYFHDMKGEVTYVAPPRLEVVPVR
jgi:hypothetical protein